MEECDCDSHICNECLYKLKIDYFNAIRRLVATGADVEEFGITQKLRDALHWFNSLSKDDMDRNRHGLVKVVNDNRPNR